MSSPIHVFLADCRSISSPRKLSLYLSKRYKEVFGKEAPSGVMLSLLQAKIGYRLEYVQFKSSGVKIPTKFMQNYEAAQKLDLEGFDDSMKHYLTSSIKQENKNMKKKLTVGGLKNVGEKTKVKLERPGAVFVHLFATNATAKLTDEVIAKEILKRCKTTKLYTAKDVKGYRNGYNNGKLTGQKGKPSVLSVSYDKK